MALQNLPVEILAKILCCLPQFNSLLSMIQSCNLREEVGNLNVWRACRLPSLLSYSWQLKELGNSTVRMYLVSFPVTLILISHGLDEVAKLKLFRSEHHFLSHHLSLLNENLQLITPAHSLSYTKRSNHVDIFPCIPVL